MQPEKRRAASRFCAALVGALSLPTAPAFAAEPAPSAPFPVPAAPSASPTASAETLAARAYELHETGRYGEAIATYLEVYRLSNAAVTLLNVATIYDRKLHERTLAADYYRRYLAAPDAEPELVKKATERLAALKAEDAPPAPSAGQALSPPSPPPSFSAASHTGALRPAGVTFTAIGVAAMGAGLVLGLLAKGKNDDADAMCSGRVCSSEDGVRLARQAGNLATASTATFFSGLALGGAGVVMILVAPRTPPAVPGQTSGQTSARLVFAPFAAPHGAGVAARASF